MKLAYSTSSEVGGYVPFNAIDKQIWRGWSDVGLFHSKIDDAYPALSIDLVTASKVNKYGVPINNKKYIGS